MYNSETTFPQSRIKPHTNSIKITAASRARRAPRRRAIVAAHVDDAAPPRRRSTNGSESARARLDARAPRRDAPPRRVDATRRPTGPTPRPRARVDLATRAFDASCARIRA
jgi:hypothetical protein